MELERAFIVRPFATQADIDFNNVEAKLISPALDQLGIKGRTTMEITRQGNIREDMFRLLVLSEYVIADVSINNANVFYELGIRHGLRDLHTFLIRAKGTKDKYPFDLQTDRYLEYDPADPGASLPDFLEALKATRASRDKDSPVFKLLPRLKPHDRAVLMVVPLDFQEAVKIAEKAGRAGDLRLLAEEARGFEWGSAGLRLVGDAQFGIKAFPGAKETFEALRKGDDNDFQANFRLGTIYQKLADTAASADAKIDCLTLSELAIQRVLARTLPPNDRDEPPAEAAERRQKRAEAHALLGSNAKTRWLDEWRAADAPEAQRAAALRSPHLASSLQHYLDGFAESPDSFYAAINALALLTVQRQLAQALPDVWAESFDDANAALNESAACERRSARLGAALNLILGNDPRIARAGEKADVWKEITRADLAFLTLDRPGPVGAAYRRALANAPPFATDAARRNLLLFRDLGVLAANLEAALKELGAAAPAKPATAPSRVLLFTGHMLDAPGRAQDKARFPNTPEAIAKARATIEQAVKAEMNLAGGVALGIAGGACGADILFHEVCEALAIPTKLFLALPERLFQEKSVNRGGPDWVMRYQALCQRKPPRYLSDTEELPPWLQDRAGYDIWQRNNLWMMFNALAEPAGPRTLIALYNRDRDSDGPGGTGHLVGVAAGWGFKTVELDARDLLTA